MRYSKREPKKTTPCAVCKKDFSIRAFEARNGRKYCSLDCSNKARIGTSGHWLGKERSEITKKKISEALIGISTWNKNLVGFMAGEKHWTFGKKRLDVTGEKNNNWKGNDVSYRNLHTWVERWLGKPSQCGECGKITYGHDIQWANKSGNYKRELSDWLRLCAKCHKAYDSKRMAEI